MKRLRSLDVFRGLVVAAMVLVNSPGSDFVYAPFRHAHWHGMTPTDLIFPAFMVIMGASAAFSRRDGRGVLTRAAALFVLGLLENFFVFESSSGHRWPGVLQRIALCYLGVEAVRRLDRPAAPPAAAALLLGYWGLLAWIPVPGHGPGVLTPDGNLPYWLDRRLLGGHLLADPWGDPEGILSTLPALATALFGLAAGRSLVRAGPAAAAELGGWGLFLAAGGAAWSLVLPLNKHLWTSSYAALAGGLSLCGLALSLRLIEGRRAAWTVPFEALGRRALAVYVLSGFGYALAEFTGLKPRLTAALFETWLPAPAASLAFAAALTALTGAAALLVAQRLDRRQQ